MSLLHKLRKTLSSGSGRASMSNSTLSRSMSRTRLFLKKQIWAWPIIAVLLLSVIGYSVRRAIESTMKSNLQSQLETLLDVQTAMLENWYRVQIANAESLANDQQVREQIYQLIDLDPATSGTAESLTTTERLRRQLEKDLGPGLSSHHYTGFFVANKAQRIVASNHETLLGREEIPEYSPFVSRALDGDTVVSPPFRSVAAMKVKSGERLTQQPTMYVCAPVRDASFQVVAVLALQIRPEQEFTRILQLGRIGESGETYAFDQQATMVSNSRFDEDLILLGILPDEPGSRSILTLQIHDPLDDMTAGFRPAVRRSELEPTRMAAAAISGQPGVDVAGYRDYRGVPVVGAWKWLADYDIGVATEVDVAEAFRPLTILQRTFWALYGLLGASALAIFVFTIVVARLQRKAQKAAIEAQQLGQYTLEKKIGAGAMGVVYRGFHAMLRRPTAVKLLNVDLVNDSSIARFEREVQITCQLNHPNTVAIYDYGRTPEGVFYYAMEYLDGIDLQTLVERYGPQDETRAIHILLQICGSLFEAHSLGLVHRDIKPANIMLNRRGAEPDVVKVLDFGLVKALDEEKQADRSAAQSLTGTPMYMSPEAIQTPAAVDARSDLYAVGAVGYFLMTGQPVFDAQNIVELCQMHVTAEPIPPSKRSGQGISDELESALLACLEKTRAKRPQTARDLAQLLLRSPAASRWSIEDSDAWWGRHEREQKAGMLSTLGNPAKPTGSESSEFDRTILGD